VSLVGWSSFLAAFLSCRRFSFRSDDKRVDRLPGPSLRLVFRLDRHRLEFPRNDPRLTESVKTTRSMRQGETEDEIERLKEGSQQWYRKRESRVMM
jgi:hypothetical protein